MFVNAIILLFSLIFLLHIYFSRNYNHWKKKNVPFLKPIPFFGNAFNIFSFKENIGVVLQKMHVNSNESFLGFFLSDRPCLLIRDPDLIKQVLVKDFDVFDNRNIAQNFKTDSLGANNLFLVKTPLWRELRKKLSGVYTSAKMRTMFEFFQEPLEDMKIFLKNQNEKKVNIKDTLSKFTTDAIFSIAFGFNPYCFRNANSEFYNLAKRLLNYRNFERGFSTFAYALAPSLVQLLGLRFIDKKSADLFRSVFRESVQTRQEKKIVRNDGIDAFMEIKRAHPELQEDQIIAQSTAFFIGGFETTSATTTFGLFHLAQNPGIQKKIRLEINNAQSKNNNQISYDCLQGMQYLDMCVKEMLRMYPIVPYLDRKSSAVYQIPGTEIILDKSTPVFIPTLGLHHDERYWSHPHVFNPDRFSPENVKSIVPYTYLPFGDGPRSCIGMRYGLTTMKLAIITIISNFNFCLNDESETSITFDTRGFMLAPEKNIYLKFINIK